jgi:ABC-type microcin C transport system permease subunit YejE
LELRDFLHLGVLSLGAELISNDKPLVALRGRGTSRF